MLAELSNPGTSSARWTDYLTAGGAMIGMRQLQAASGMPTTRYFHSDHLGSVSVITDESGAVVERLGYDAWGKRRFPNGSDDTTGSITSQTTRGFTGEEELSVAGLVHLNGRVYDPIIARMISADPVVQSPMNTQGWNRYAYVSNGPLKFIDPTGFDWVVGEDGLIAPPSFPPPLIFDGSMNATFDPIHPGTTIGVPPPSLGLPGLSCCSVLPPPPVFNFNIPVAGPLAVPAVVDLFPALSAPTPFPAGSLVPAQVPLPLALPGLPASPAVGPPTQSNSSSLIQPVAANNCMLPGHSTAECGPLEAGGGPGGNRGGEPFELRDLFNLLKNAFRGSRTVARGVDPLPEGGNVAREITLSRELHGEAARNMRQTLLRRANQGC